MSKFLIFLLFFLAPKLNAQHHPQIWTIGRSGANNIGELLYFDLDSQKQHSVFDFKTTNQNLSELFSYQLSEDSLGNLFGNNQWSIFTMDTFRKMKILITVDTSFGRLSGPLIYRNGKFYGVFQYLGTKNYGGIFEYDPINHTISKKLKYDNPLYSGTASLIASKNSSDQFYFALKYGLKYGIILNYDISKNKLDTVFDFNTVRAQKYAYPTNNMVVRDSILYGTTSYFGKIFKASIFQINLNTKVFKELTALDTSYLMDEKNIGQFNLLGNKLYFTVQRLSSSNPYGAIFSMNTDTKITSVEYSFTTLKYLQPSLSLLWKDSLFYCYFNQIANINANRLVIFTFNPKTNVFIKKFADTLNRILIQNQLVNVNGKVIAFAQGISHYPSNSALVELTSDSTRLKVFYELIQSPDGANPDGRLLAVNHSIWGVCAQGGSANYGTIFNYNKLSNQFTKVHDFINEKEGIFPSSNLIFINNVIYGITKGGGNNNYGVFFKYDLLLKKYEKVFDFKAENTMAVSADIFLKDSFIYTQTSTALKYNINSNSMSSTNNYPSNFINTNGKLYYFINTNQLIEQMENGQKNYYAINSPNWSLNMVSNIVRVNGELVAYSNDYKKSQFVQMRFNLASKKMALTGLINDTLFNKANLGKLISANNKIYAYTLDYIIVDTDAPFVYKRYLLEIDPFKNTTKRVSSIINDSIDLPVSYFFKNVAKPCFATDTNTTPSIVFNDFYLKTCSKSSDTVNLFINDADGDSLLLQFNALSGDSLNIRKVNESHYQFIFNKNARDTETIVAFYSDTYSPPLSKRVNIYSSKFISELKVDKMQLCYNDSAKLSVSGNFNVVLWNDNDTNRVRIVKPGLSTAYQVVVINRDCLDTLKKTINVYPKINFNFNCLIDTICQNYPLIKLVDHSIVSPSKGVFSGLKVGNGFFYPGNGFPNKAFNSYIYYQYTDLNKCLYKGEDSIFVDSCDYLGVKNIETDDNQLKVYPNPSKNKLFIQSVYPMQSIEIIGLNGQSMGTYYTDAFIYEIDMSAFSKGLYLVKVSDLKHVSFRKIILE
ncbi:MAG: T9SS type A sorting domain-containing protein [bacterium]|nr:T9SS type A sorting domain-containing protein [bacterium]